MSEETGKLLLFFAVALATLFAVIFTVSDTHILSDLLWGIPLFGLAELVLVILGIHYITRETKPQDE